MWMVERGDRGVVFLGFEEKIHLIQRGKQHVVWFGFDSCLQKNSNQLINLKKCDSYLTELLSF